MNTKERSIAEIIGIANRNISNGQILVAKNQLHAVLLKQHRNIDALAMLGVISSQEKDLNSALEYFTKALKFSPTNAQLLFCRGNTHFLMGNSEEAVIDLEKSILIDNKNLNALMAYGNSLSQSGQQIKALDIYDRAISTNPKYSDLYFNRGIVLKNLNRIEEALDNYKMALDLNPNYYQAYINLGNLLYELKKHKEALNNINKALLINPESAIAYYNRGNIFKSLNKNQDAYENYNKTLSLNPNYIEALISRGALQKEYQNFKLSLDDYLKAYCVNPEAEYLRGDLLNSRMYLCDWDEFSLNVDMLIKDVHKDKKVTPFILLGLTDSLEVQHKSAKNYIKDKYPENTELGPFNIKASDKLRIGYFSPDFRQHVVAQWVSELFELHNKEKFEIYGFYFGPESNDAAHQRIVNSLTGFYNVQEKTDKEIAFLARSIGLDIAIDLAGFTANQRTGIFSYRAAPIQVNYIGYTGTMGADYIDYIVADPVLITVESQKFYSEKVVYLPNSYKVSDRTIKISNRIFKREELGLPSDGFIYACFNNNYKITPVIFDIWLNILKKTSNSVLWLSQMNCDAIDKLRSEASNKGLEPNRIIIANKVDNFSEHLARIQMADLFLDTFPYNAHTTAGDALWAGLPVLTCAGESFASRVAASFLKAIDLPELVKYSFEEYERAAIELSKNPIKIKEIKEKLKKSRDSSPLFDTPRVTQQLERAFEIMHEKYCQGLTPSNIYIEN